MRLTNGGNVGIGTASPGSKLNIETGGLVTLIKQTAASLSNGVYALDIDNLAQNSNMSTAGAFRIQTNTNSNSFIVNGLGNVGIGYTAPAAKLVVDGTTLINTNTDNGVDKLQVQGSISGIGFKQNYVAKTGAYTATNADYVIDCTSGSFTITLYAASGNAGRILIVKNSGAGTITVDGNASETIDGATTYAMAVQYATVQIMSDGTNWKIIAKF